ncbi:hypothetical protein ACHWQZ_G001851 [Mnemiopsis leidyi]
MTQYPLLCLILYLLSHYTVLSSTLDCSFTPKDHNHRLQSTTSYRCPHHCKSSRSSHPDLRKVELNYRICSHPDLTDAEFKIVPKDPSHVAILRFKSLNMNHYHRRKRALTLTPQWQSEPQSLSVNQGNKISLVCSIAAVGESVSYHWYYSDTFPANIGSTLSELYNGITDETGTLSIASASGTDAGYYQCKVTDVTKDGTHTIFSNIVEVQIESYYLKTPASKQIENKVSLLAEDVLILDCPQIDSNPPATITWYKNNEVFKDEGAFVYPFEGEEFQYHSETYTVSKNSLVLMSMTTAHNGVYKCRATNSKTGQYFDLKEYNVQNLASSDSSLVDVKPTVLKEGQITVEKGSTVELYCLGVGHPATMTYTWTVGDGTALSFSDRIVLSDFGRQVTISNAKTTDAGLYKCSCLNTKGNTDSYITLKVKESTTVPDITITQTPASLYIHDVYQGEEAKSIFIPCTATGADQVRFLKNGALLDLSSRYTFKENVGLTFTSYDSRDSGVYQCVAFNSKHWKQKMTFVMITEKVTATASADVTLINSEASLSCAVTGYPYPDVSWSYNNQQITNTQSSHSPYVIDSPTSHKLVIKNIGFTDGGVYTCTAVSRALNYQPEYTHSATSEVTLTIEQEIEMKAAASSVTATVDDTLKLGCTANAKPTVKEVTWYVNNTIIDTTKEEFKRVSISTKEVNDHQAYSELTITKLEIKDGGTYKCEGNNTAKGNTTTSSATTDVLVKYLSVSVADSVRAIAAGDKVVITCTAQGSPKPELIRWFLGSTDGKVIQNSDAGYKITNNPASEKGYESVLEVEKQMTNQDYVCEATNYLNNVAQFDDHKVIVRTFTKTEASRETSFVSTNEGESASLTCFCSGVPLPSEVLWKKNGVTISSTASQTITNTPKYDPDFKLTSVLTYKNPTSSDIATHTCQCNNSFQDQTYTDQTTVELRVVTQVSITWSADNPKAAQYNKELKLTCTAAGLPRPTSIVWSRKLTSSNSDTFVTLQTNTGRFSENKTVVDISTLRSVLTISNTEYNDDGTYNCYADNRIGDVVYSRNAQSTLLIFQNPTVDMGTTERAGNVDDNIELSCTVSSKPAPTKMEWHFGNTKIANQPTSTASGYSRSSKYTVNALSGPTEGKYRCLGYHTYEGQEATGEGYTYVRLHRPYEVSSATVPASVATVNEYTAQNLTCSGIGVPEVSTFKWTLESVINPSNEVTSDIGEVVTERNYERPDLNIEVTSTLVVKSVKYTNLGIYKCATSQTWGGETSSANKTFEISVNFDAKLSSASGSTEVFQDVGSQIRLTCVVYGNPAPDDITWKWADGAAISNGNEFNVDSVSQNKYKKQSTLQFAFLPIYHKKDLQCMSKNSLSASEQKLTFTLNMKHDTMGIIQSGSSKSGETVLLTCLTTFEEGAISWHKDNQLLNANNRITFATNTTYSTINSVLTITDTDDTADSGEYGCKVTTDNQTSLTSMTLVIGSGVSAASDGLSTGIVIALSVLGVFIVIVVILIVVVFVHGRRRSKTRGMFDERSVPESYENQAYDDRNLHTVISMPDTAIDNLPKVVEPIVMSKNEPDHDIKEATIMKQATLTQQRKRNY